MSLLQTAKDYLAKRQRSYLDVFSPESVQVQAVLKDLAKFCRATDTTFHPDPRVHAQLEGRREVWLRICHHIKLDPDQLWTVYGRKDLE